MSSASPAPYISVIIPVYNEEENLRELGERLMRTLTAMGRSFEIILVDDGSSDRSWEILTELHAKYPQNLRALQFNRNFGQHQAIFAGFQAARGQVMVTLDADLQNPPEEIPRLVAKLEEGYDTVGGWRENRRDSLFRKLPSHLVNYRHVQGHRGQTPGLRLHAAGLPPGGDRRHQPVPGILQLHPGPGQSLFPRVAEIPVGHAERERGKSKYSLFKLLRLNFDLMTGFSNLPIHAVGFMGVAIAFLGLFFGLFLFSSAASSWGRKWRGSLPCSPSSSSSWASTPWAWPSSANTSAASTGSPGPPPLSSSGRLWDRTRNSHKILLTEN